MNYQNVQIANINHLTTVAYSRFPTSLKPEIHSLSNSLYFQIVLKFADANFDGDERKRANRCLRATAEFFGGRAKAVGFNGSNIYLLIALPPHILLENFVEQVRIVSKSVMRRKLNAKRFVWNRTYEVSTVGFSQIETISREIRKCDQAITAA